MTPDVRIDPAHKQPIPTGRAVAKVLRTIFSHQRREVIQSLRGNRPVSLAHWTAPMTETLVPLLLPHWITGARAALRRLERSRLPKRFRYYSKGILSFAWSSFMRLVQGACQKATMLFCSETNDTATREINEARQALREGLAEGLTAGEAGKQLTERTRALFDDPMRAHRIAMTEASRATHGGQVELARGTGIVKGKKWLASSDACERCRALNGKVVDLDAAFYVDPKGGPYATVMYPPLHPNCMCAMTEELQ